MLLYFAEEGSFLINVGKITIFLPDLPNQFTVVKTTDIALQAAVFIWPWVLAFKVIILRRRKV